MRVVYREDQQQREHEVLSEEAAFADGTEGRRSSSEPDALRTDYQRDRDKILHSKSFRRLSHKTQVFLASEGDHFRTRLTIRWKWRSSPHHHRASAERGLDRAISLGHDLGTPLRPHRRGGAGRVPRAPIRGSRPARPRPRRSTATTSSRCAWWSASRTAARV